MPHSLNISASCLAVAVCMWFVQVAISLVSGSKCNHLHSSRFFALPCIFLLASAFFGWSSNTFFNAPEWLRFGFEPISQHIDGLASMFLGLLGVVGLSVSSFSPGYLMHLQDRINSGFYWASLSIFMLSMALVVSSANAIAFLVFWEMMSLSSLALVVSEHKIRKVQQSGLIYLGATRIATAFLAAGFLWMHALCHSWNFHDWIMSASALIPSLLILVGLCIKAGAFPFHIWLPYAHPAAPAPVSALMSGVMIKIAIYAMIRILIVQDLSHPVLGHVALALGVISALWGVLFALVQHDLKRLLAYSSVENIGLILMGIGLCILARVQDMQSLAAIALTAAIFHCLNHGIFKSLLFFGAGAVDASAHTRNMLHLGGLGRVMPWTMGAFILGSATICAFPPLNGFASKWLLYQGLLQTAWQSNSLVERSLGLVSVGILALVGGLAVASFTKAVGITFLGNSRQKSAGDHVHEASTGMIVAQSLMAAFCVLIGLGASFVCKNLQFITAACLKMPEPAFSYFNVPVPMLTLATFSIFAMAYGLFLKPSKLRKFITWECGFGDLSPRTQGTAVSFAQPVARIFSAILRFKLFVEISGRDRRNFPEHIKVEPQMVSLLETIVYLPTISWIQNLSRAFAKLQAGSIHLYLMYVCATLVVLVLIGTRL